MGVHGPRGEQTRAPLICGALRSRLLHTASIHMDVRPLASSHVERLPWSSRRPSSSPCPETTQHDVKPQQRQLVKGHSEFTAFVTMASSLGKRQTLLQSSHLGIKRTRCHANDWGDSMRFAGILTNICGRNIDIFLDQFARNVSKCRGARRLVRAMRTPSKLPPRSCPELPTHRSISNLVLRESRDK